MDKGLYLIIWVHNGVRVRQIFNGNPAHVLRVLKASGIVPAKCIKIETLINEEF